MAMADASQLGRFFMPPKLAPHLPQTIARSGEDRRYFRYFQEFNGRLSLAERGAAMGEG